MKYTLIRSNRKTVSLEIKRSLDIIVRAPNKMTDREVSAFLAKNRSWIDRNIKLQQSLQRPLPTDTEVALLRSAARAYIPDRVSHYSHVMGLTPTGVKITSAKTRFGSCSGKNSLCFSCFLMQYPPEAVDYVVVHELAHIRHKNHQREFWDLVGKYIPDYKKRRDMLKNVPESYLPWYSKSPQ